MGERVVNEVDHTHVERWLHPLLAQTPSARVKTAETLAAMLDVGDSATKVAEELGVPRSTAESRLQKLRVTFKVPLARRESRRALRSAVEARLPLWREEAAARTARPPRRLRDGH